MAKETKEVVLDLSKYESLKTKSEILTALIRSGDYDAKEANVIYRDNFAGKNTNFRERLNVFLLEGRKTDDEFVEFIEGESPNVRAKIKNHRKIFEFANALRDFYESK